MNNAIVDYSASEEYGLNKRKKWRNKSELDKMVAILNFINKLKLTDSDTVPNGNMLKFFTVNEQIKEFISDHRFN